MQGSAENTAEIRSLNKKKMIHYLRKHPPATRRQIAEDLRLSFATVSNLASQMLADGVLCAQSACESRGGRIPDLISLNGRACCALCLDLSKQESVRVCILNLHGEMLADTLLTDMHACAYEELLARCRESAQEMAHALDMPMDGWIGVGAAVPGIMDLKRHVLVNCTYAKLENKPLAMDLKRYFGLPCYVGNETNLMALAVRLKEGDDQSLQEMIYLYVDEGLGIGIVCGGNLLVGAHGLGGEINHWSLGSTGTQACGCGRTGCLETELSVSGFLRKYRDLRHEEVRWADFVSAVQAKDQAALAVVEENGRLLGRLLSGLTGLFDPQAYWLGGCIVDIYPNILAFVQAQMRCGYPFAAEHEIPIHRSDDYKTLALLGCEELCFTHWQP